MRVHAFQKYKILKQTAVWAVIFSFILTSLLCCCLTRAAHAGSTAKTEKRTIPSCHQSSADHKAHSQKSKSCDCSKMTRESAAQIATSFDFNDVFPQFGKVSTFLSSLYLHSTTLVLRFDTGPPVLRYSIPVYLQTSNLRI